ncbi:MAG TPA: oxidoreductase [Solirubrobacteraceae bacterium]|nr:oxidoreductase [Solirubrobacteraceae bacterium]HME03490.1 oxidoreductase [Solirubrobacteraceae bacterium]
MSWTAADIPDQKGRVAVVTGANGGLGLETSRALAGAGAHVVMAARNQEKAAQALADIRGSVGDDASLEVVPLDLGSQASVRAAAEEVLRAHDRLDILVNNAGVMGIPERRTVDGFEMQLGVDHLGHWALTALLMPALLRADAARVVTVTSTAHHMGRAVDPANPHLHGRYGPWRAYGQAKLANFHFGIGLQRELHAAGAPASSLIAHPGLSNTDLQAVSVQETGGGISQRFFHRLAGSTGMTPAQGALPQLRAATDPAARGGEFYAPRFVNNGPPVRRPILRRIGMDTAIARLWEVSERETGLEIDVRGGAPKAPAPDLAASPD